MQCHTGQLSGSTLQLHKFAVLKVYSISNLDDGRQIDRLGQEEQFTEDNFNITKWADLEKQVILPTVF